MKKLLNPIYDRGENPGQVGGQGRSDGGQGKVGQMWVKGGQTGVKAGQTGVRAHLSWTVYILMTTSTPGPSVSRLTSSPSSMSTSPVITRPGHHTPQSSPSSRGCTPEHGYNGFTRRPSPGETEPPARLPGCPPKSTTHQNKHIHIRWPTPLNPPTIPPSHQPLDTSTHLASLPPVSLKPPTPRNPTHSPPPSPITPPTRRHVADGAVVLVAVAARRRGRPEPTASGVEHRHAEAWVSEHELRHARDANVAVAVVADAQLKHQQHLVTNDITIAQTPAAPGDQRRNHSSNTWWPTAEPHCPNTSST